MRVTIINSINEIKEPGVYYETPTGSWYVKAPEIPHYFIGCFYLEDTKWLETQGQLVELPVEPAGGVDQNTLLKAIAISQRPELAKELTSDK